jgi:hypothetical protein
MQSPALPAVDALAKPGFAGRGSPMQSAVQSSALPGFAEVDAVSPRLEMPMHVRHPAKAGPVRMGPRFRGDDEVNRFHDPATV